MLDHEKAEKAFREENLFSKAELVASFRGYMEYVATEDETGISEAMREKHLELCQRFLEKLRACHLPTQVEPRWFYEYDFEDTSIELNLCRATELEWRDDGLTMTSEVEFTLICVECEMLSVEEFAKLYGVTPVTVRQWIRRGKLRTARKMGGEWVIPELADKPGRGYEPAWYVMKEPGAISIEEYPFVEHSTMILIDQDKDNRDLFHVRFVNEDKKMHQVLDLGRKDTEALERALIATGKTTQAGRIQYVPEKIVEE